ncbi:LacI family DNA-binding transcriptional regulator [Actinomadura parmotrematis]|uniref:LacI family transcriptional regulator n=1 Tax=Actinomadura parmotrematis TaxID=2864039 RepID=A0ABS7FSR2_9ACTN|nr:LacI family DNA-binding transcriptional regulator [Actinomadura parmotrematis]MBW8483427.1 LacI family transcriptional regulator [Actinomadura parmotrematis]
MAATVKDVAAAAGVGIATVSRVFSGNGAVGAATRERVLAAARELDYRPSAVGRSLKTRRTGGIGLVVPDVTDPFQAELAAGVLACARDLGEHVVLDVSGGDPGREAAIVERMVGQRLDGVVAVPAGDRAPWAAAAAAGGGVVFADRALPGLPDVPAVLADDAAGVASLAEYLLGLGHRRIALLGAAPRGRARGERERAFREALAAAGVAVDEELMVAARPARDSAYAAAAGLLQSRPDATAVLAATHLLGEAAVLVARELDLRVPADVSIAMVGDVAWAELCDPPLTAVARPGRDIGYRACETLLRDRNRRGPAGPVRLPAELVVRGSCGPCRGGRR